MRSVVHCLVVLGAIGVLAGRATADGTFVYPQKGQTADQQNKDSQDWYGWAKAQSSVDPGAPPPPARPGQHARGAGVGAAAGAIAGDAGKGAGVGAVLGGVRGRRQSTAAQQAQQQGTRSAYDRAFAACLEGRGHTVR